MQRFEKILVYARSAGPDDPALLRAAELAQAHGARVELVDVVEELPAYVILLTPPTWDLAQLVVADRRASLHRAAGALRNHGLEAAVNVLRGDPAIAITRHVLTGGHDLVLKTARPESAEQRLPFGTLAKRLLRICPCPVWIVQPRPSVRLARIVAAVDLDEEDHQKSNLNRQILETAAALAQQEDARLHVLHAWEVFGETLLRNRISPEKIAQYAIDCETAARLRLERFLNQFDSPLRSMKPDLVKGDPEEAINRFVRRHDSDLVVIGTICRTGIAGQLIGNTAEKVLRQINCSVLAVKPEGFQSPVAAGFAAR
jgi:nucleotide-binding universal stress UspA family protein